MGRIGTQLVYLAVNNLLHLVRKLAVRLPIFVCEHYSHFHIGSFRAIVSDDSYVRQDYAQTPLLTIFKDGIAENSCKIAGILFQKNAELLEIGDRIATFYGEAGLAALSI